MAPTTPFSVEWQTDQIIQCLFEDEDEKEHNNARRCFDAQLETDSSPSKSDEDTFDPVLIADKLKSVADSLNNDVKFKAVVADLKQAVAKEALEAAFRHGVDAICQTHVSQRAEVVSELQLIKASVALGLYVKKSLPELKNKIQSVMAAFLTRRVGKWVTAQGGWDKVV